MTVVQAKPIGKKWKDRFDLSRRTAPDFYENVDEVRQTPYAGAIRTTLVELGASAVFCVQGVPTVVLLAVDEYDRDKIVRVHAALWNQGLASLLLVISGDTVRAFSLARIPQSGDNRDFDVRCLIPGLSAATDALAFSGIIYGAESGRLWEQHGDYFKPRDRVDKVLLGNLNASYESLCHERLSHDAAQALLIQTMFIAYLEDREIADFDYFRTASDGMVKTFSDLLLSERPEFLQRLFERLRTDFSGDLFVAPCSFDSTNREHSITRQHMAILARFRDGRPEMGKGATQLRFWGYDFKFIPVELISAVYDRFLGEKEEERRKFGAYYTPMFLADTVIAQVWDSLPLATKDAGTFFDPACGSGVFLVRAFQRLCEHTKESQNSQTIPWSALLAILKRLRGCDLNGGAVRIAVFSLYIALLEEVSPPSIRLLIQRGRLLPGLWGNTLRTQDFFVAPDDMSADVIVGNPPWSSRHGRERSAVKWCREAGCPMPGEELAWAFVWKSLRSLSGRGVIAFLLPAMTFLHNHSKGALHARERFSRDARIRRIVNFADLRFQLFESAVRPAALLIFCGRQEKGDYRFEYWVPKADQNLRHKRVITLRSADRRRLESREVINDPLVFKRASWITDPEAKLFNYLARLPKIGDLVNEYGRLRRRNWPVAQRWVVGHGFKPARADRLEDERYSTATSDIVGQTPFLPISAFRALAIDSHGLGVWQEAVVHRRGFEEGFHGARILVPRGVKVKQGRLRAAFVREPLTFQDIIQAIAVPPGDEDRGRLLTGLLNSKLFFWYAFHGTTSFGSDRPEVQQAQLLQLPFPSPRDLPETEGAETAAVALVSLVEDARKGGNDRFMSVPNSGSVFDDVDRLTSAYFGLSQDEVMLVDDFVKYIAPAVQPSRGAFPDVWKIASYADRETYATTLMESMRQWFESGSDVTIVLVAWNEDLAVLRLSLRERRGSPEYSEEDGRSLGAVLTDLYAHIHRPLPGNFQLMPDFRLFVGNDLYLVKPTQRQYWLRTAALADADAIALDLHDAIRLKTNVQ